MNQQTLPVPGGASKPPAKIDPAPARFRQVATQIAGSLLGEWVGEERAREATGRIAAAISASASAARNPNDFYACTPQSIGVCVALSALTGIMPGTGSTALAYVYPRRPRKNETPQLQYSLSHRGMNALAKRCGLTMIATPVGTADKLAITVDGEVEVQALDLDNPPTTWEELRGVMVVTKETAYGRILHRGWVPKKLIEARRRLSLSDKSDYSPWKTWPVEMSIKTAMHYAISRGWCVIDDTEATRALSADSVSDYQVGHEPIPAMAVPPSGRQSLRNGDPVSPAPEQVSEQGVPQSQPAQPHADDGEIPNDIDQDATAFADYQSDIEDTLKGCRTMQAIQDIGADVKRQEWLTDGQRGECVAMIQARGQQLEAEKPKPARSRQF